MNLKVKRSQLIYLLNIIKYFTSKAFISFEHDKVKFSFFCGNKDSLHIINIDYESYIYTSKITMEFNPTTLLDKIDNMQRNEFINLSLVIGENYLMIESVSV